MKRRSGGGDELTLIPIMNLVTLLIPFLLMSAQFVSYAMIESTLPASCDGSGCGEADPDAIDVRLLVQRGTFRLETSGSGLEALDAGLHIPCPGADCEAALPELRAQLTLLKDAHPGLRQIVLVPDGGVSYDALVLAMDGVREDPAAAGLPGERCDGRCLFPQLIVAGGVAP